MKFANQELRNKLAAEYVLGTMSAHARRRFAINLKENPPLRRAVAEWEKRLLPLALTLPEVDPPSRVWQVIESRIRAYGQVRASGEACRSGVSRPLPAGLWRWRC
jgi:anti-sigma-K factor RskA